MNDKYKLALASVFQAFLTAELKVQQMNSKRAETK